MRERAWIAIGAVVLALALGFIGQAADSEGVFVASGLAWAVALVIGISLLPFWRNVLPDVPPMPHLFRRPVEGERWCVTCGSPTAQMRACTVCGAPAKVPRRKAGQEDAAP